MLASKKRGWRPGVVPLVAVVWLMADPCPVSAQVPPTPGLIDTTRGTVHVVRAGDTLWDLSRTYLKTPWFWPVLHQANQRLVSNPHWIYPGQRLWIPGQGGPPIVLTFEEVWAGAPTVAPDVSRRAAEIGPEAARPVPTDPGYEEVALPVVRSEVRAEERSYYPLASPQAVLAAGFIDEPRDWPVGRIIGGDYADMNMSLDNRVFLDVGAERARPGDLYLVVEQGNRVRHPEWRHYLGRNVKVKGIIRLNSVHGSTSGGVLIAVFDSVRRRDRVIPAPMVDVRPWMSFEDVKEGRSGQVVARAKEDGNLHPYDILFIDGGEQEGVEVGDLYRIRRLEAERGRLRFFEEELGRGVVIAVQDRTATLMLLSLRSPDIMPGENLEQIGRSTFAAPPGGPGGG